MWKSPEIGFALASSIAQSHKTNPTGERASLSEKTYWLATPLDDPGLRVDTQLT
jgi:hypothetical protein